MAHNYFLYIYYEMGTGWEPVPEPEPVVTVPEPEPVVPVPEPEPVVPVPEPEPVVPVPEPEPEPEPEPVVPVPEPEPEPDEEDDVEDDDGDVPVARSAALIEEALNAGVSLSTTSSQ
jgi:outer membrane biosynthesis protein TonB